MTKLSRWVLALVLSTSAAVAQGSGDSAALARELFSQARALMESGDFAAACPKFAESQRLDPGGGTLLNLALCNEKLGKTATAWAQFNQAIIIARRDGRADRETFAKEHVEALAPHLSRLTIQVPPAARAPGMRLELNGVEIGQAAWGDPLPVDPGEQEILATAPGKIDRRTKVTVGTNAERKEVTLSPLRDAPKAPKPPPSPAPTPAPSRGKDDGPTLWPFWMTTGVLGATAGVLTVNAYASHQNANEERDRFGVTEGEYESARDKAERDALIADIAWGVTAVSAGVALYVTLTSDEPASKEVVRLGAGPGNVQLSGRF